MIRIAARLAGFAWGFRDIAPPLLGLLLVIFAMRTFG